MATTLAGGTVVTVDAIRRADVRIEGETVAAVGENLRRPGDTLVDVSGCLLFPGAIDPHTHFDLCVGATTTADDFASGTRAAAAGGTTTVIDFATQNRGETLAEALRNWHAKADGRCSVDYGFHLALSDLNAGVLHELEALAARDGVSSVKLYLAYKGSMQVDDGSLLRVMQMARKAGLLVSVHCENGDVIDVLVRQAKAQGHTSVPYHALTRPVIAEREAVQRAISLAEIAGAPLYIVHVSSAAALDVIRDAQRRGVEVYAETCPQYLLLDESCYERNGFEAAKYVISPPLRAAKNQAALWDGLGDVTLSTVGSDHCSFNMAGQKELGRDDFSKIPNGAPGVENRFGLLYTHGVTTNRLTPNQFVAVTSTNAAKLFGLFPRKGTIAAGSDADIVVWDPALEAIISANSHYQRVDYNPYEGFRQAGIARHVFLRGRQIVTNGVLSGGPAGRYLVRQPYYPQPCPRPGGWPCSDSN